MVKTQEDIKSRIYVLEKENIILNEEFKELEDCSNISFEADDDESDMFTERYEEMEFLNKLLSDNYKELNSLNKKLIK